MKGGHEGAAFFLTEAGLLRCLHHLMPGGVRCVMHVLGMSLELPCLLELGGAAPFLVGVCPDRDF